MKKIYLSLLLITLLASSCNRGAIHGRLTFSVAKHATPRVDYYGQIYITKLKVDTIAHYLNIVRVQESINKEKQYIHYAKDKNRIDSLNRIVADKQHVLADLMVDSVQFQKLERCAFENLERIKSDQKNTLELEADESGKYSTRLKAGKYYVVFVSEGAKRDNVLERRGQILIRETEIIKGEHIVLDAMFLP